MRATLVALARAGTAGFSGGRPLLTMYGPERD